MPRSEESLQRRREYSKKWRAEHPDYHKSWRASHKAQEAERIKRWRQHNQDLVRAQKQRWWKRFHIAHPTERLELPAKFVGHPFFDTARFICGPMPYFPWDVWTWEESMSAAVVALVEGKDPECAVLAARKYERAWQLRHTPFYNNVDVAEDGRIVFVASRDD